MKWFVEGVDLVLKDDRGDTVHWFSLGDCNTSAGLCDRIFQVVNKTWATATIIGEMIMAIDKAIDVQTNLCTFGIEKGPIPVEDMLALLKNGPLRERI